MLKAVCTFPNVIPIMNTSFTTLIRRFFPTYLFWQENSKTFYLLSLNSTVYKCVKINNNQWNVQLSNGKYIHSTIVYNRVKDFRSEK